MKTLLAPLPVFTITLLAASWIGTGSIDAADVSRELTSAGVTEEDCNDPASIAADLTNGRGLDYNGDGLITPADFNIFLGQCSKLANSDAPNTTGGNNGDASSGSVSIVGSNINVATILGMGHQSLLTALFPDEEFGGDLYVEDGCPIGSKLHELIAPRSEAGIAYLDRPLHICYQEGSVNSNEYIVPQTNNGEKLVFGGFIGTGRDFQTDTTKSYPNPYTSIDYEPSSMTSTCPDGFENFQVFGANKKDYGLRACAKRAAIEEEIELPYDFRGFASGPSECGNYEAHQILGSPGMPTGESSINLDNDLFLCVERTDSNAGPVDPPLAEVVAMKVLGLDTFVDDATGRELASISSSNTAQSPIRIPSNAAFAITVKAEMAYFDGTSSRVVGDQFPHSDYPTGQVEMPFRVEFNFNSSASTRMDGQSPVDPFAPYTIGTTNENADGTQTIFYFVRTEAALGTFEVTAKPLFNDNSYGEPMTIHFEIYDPTDPGNDDTTPPAAPTDLNSRSVQSRSLRLEWNTVSEPDVAGYYVYEVGGQIDRLQTSNNDLLISGLTPDTDYQFQVSSFDFSGNESAKSAAYAVTTSSDDGGNGNGSNQVDGWTVFEPSPDSRLIYVSSIHPNRTNSNNDGSDPNRPLASLRQGYDLLRSGKPDWLLLERGSTFAETLGGFAKAGRNADEKMVIQAYGPNANPSTNPTGDDLGPRPIILAEGGYPISMLDNTSTSRRHLAFMHLHLKPTASSRDYGISLNSNHTDDILLEGLRIEGFGVGVSIRNDNSDQYDPLPPVDISEDIVLRRSIIANNGGGSRGQGLIILGGSITLEENFIYRNGWNGDQRAGNQAHNLYLQMNHGATSSKLLNNIIGRASNNCAQMRDGGVAEGNVFFECPSALTMGNTDDNDKPAAVPVYGRVRFNTILNPSDINDSGQGWGIGPKNLIPHPDTGQFSEVSDNIIYNPARTSVQAIGIILNGNGGNPLIDGLAIERNIVKDHRRALDANDSWQYMRNFEIQDNVFYSDYQDAIVYEFNSLGNSNFDVSFRDNEYWSDQVDIFRPNSLPLNFAEWMDFGSDTGSVLLNQRPQFLDDTRDLDSYAQSLGLSGQEELFQRLLEVDKGNWPEAYSADAINDYIREGFTPQ